MSNADLAVARAYLELAKELSLKAANIASACEGGEHLEVVGDLVHKTLDGALG